MKKGLLILLGIILVAGCSSNDTNELEPRDQEGSNKIVDSDKNHENPDGATEDKENLEGDSDSGDTNDIATNSDLENLPEFNTIAKQIDLDIYQGVVETDNKGNRIILFKNEKGHSEYKSIFIKRDNRLKIVQFDDDGLLYNEIIK